MTALPFRVYSRRGCHLCEQMIEELEPMLRGRARLAVADVDERDEWRERFGDRVPVLEYDGIVICEFHLDKAAVADALS